jgi:hypothetical protein
MKINWGYFVTFLYIGFVGLIAYFVGRSVNQKIDLVTDDYYAQELKYQDRIESSRRNNELKAPLAINLEQDGIHLKFPDELKANSIQGEILFFCPSDNTRDFKIKVDVDSKGEQLVPFEKLKAGMYRVKVNYKSGDQDYYAEKQVVLNGTVLN